MKIYLSFNTAGSSTNSLNGDLKNFDKLIRAPLVYIFYDGILHEEAIQDFDFDEFVQLKYRIKLF